MTEKRWVRHIYKNFVIFFKRMDWTKKILCGPGVAHFLSAETHSVGLHQGQRWGVSRSPHKHNVIKWRGGKAIFKDQLYSWINVVESSLIDLESPVLNTVSHSSGGEGLSCLWFPSQSLVKYFFLNASCWRKVRMLPNGWMTETEWSSNELNQKLPITCAADLSALSFPFDSGW